MLNHKLTIFKEKCISDKIPILSDEGVNLINALILKENLNHLLEIGTAVGYSAISFALNNPNLKITTIERDSNLAGQALKNIEDFGLSARITVINADALTLDLSEEFDLIFIDAAKAQYLKFFNRYEKNLIKGGFIVTDNLNFHNLKEEEVSKRTARLIQKLKEFKEEILKNPNYETTIYNVGDGMSVSKKR